MLNWELMDLIEGKMVEEKFENLGYIVKKIREIVEVISRVLSLKISIRRSPKK